MSDALRELVTHKLLWVSRHNGEAWYILTGRGWAVARFLTYFVPNGDWAVALQEYKQQIASQGEDTSP